MTTHKLTGFFAAPPTPLEKLIRQREIVQSCADRNAEEYARVLRNIDSEIAALKAQEAKNG